MEPKEEMDVLLNKTPCFNKYAYTFAENYIPVPIFTNTDSHSR